MTRHLDMTQANFFRMLRNNVVEFAGNERLKIYGRLACRSGKRMKRSNRVFFDSECEAIGFGFRPCAKCMPDQYRAWKSKLLDGC